MIITNISTKYMNADIIIPIWNQRESTKDCIEYLIRNTDYPYRLILIDNGSDEPTRHLLESFKRKHDSNIIIIRNEKNIGFIKAVNQGLRLSTAPYACILNNDTKPSAGWLTEMVKFAERHPDIGLINPVCDEYATMSSEDRVRRIRENKGKYVELNQCFLFATLIKREVIEKTGYLDETFGMGCLEDADYAIRAAMHGYKCAMLYSAYVEHTHGISFKALGNRDVIVSKNELEFFKKWPRHLRVGIGVSLTDNDSDSKIQNLLEASLFLAREWCWLNIWIFGDKKTIAERTTCVSEKISMPNHQNIKFNYFSSNLKETQLLIKLVERSFGTKRRKKYDIFFVDDKNASDFLKNFYIIHSTKIATMDFENNPLPSLRKVIYEMRGMCIQDNSNPIF